MKIIFVVLFFFILSTVIAADNVTSYVFPRGGASVNGTNNLLGTRVFINKWINITGIGSNFTRIESSQGYASNFSNISNLIIGSDVCVGAGCGYIYRGGLADGVLTCHPFYYETYQDCSGDSRLQCNLGQALCCDAKECAYGANCYATATRFDVLSGGGSDAEYCKLGKWYDQDQDQTYCGFTWDNTGDGAFAEYSAGQTACCGDDANENARGCNSHASNNDGANTCPGTDSSACCDLASDCIDDGACYPSNTVATRDADGDGEVDYCSSGTWYDCYDDDDCSGNLYCLNNECQRLDVATVRIFPNYTTGTVVYAPNTYNLSAEVTHNIGIDSTSCQYTIDGGQNWAAADYTGGALTGTCYKNNLVSASGTILNFTLRANSTNDVDGNDIRGQGAIVNITIDAAAPSLSSVTTNNSVLANGTEIDYSIADTGVGLLSAYWSNSSAVTNYTLLNMTYEETNDTCDIYVDCRATIVNITYLYGVHDTLAGTDSDNLFGQASTAGTNAKDDDALICNGAGTDRCYARIRVNQTLNGTFGVWYYTFGSLTSYVNVSFDNVTWVNSTRSGGWHWDYLGNVNMPLNGTFDIYLAGGDLLTDGVVSYFDQVLLEPRSPGASSINVETTNFLKGYRFIDMWVTDLLNNTIYRKYKYDIGTAVKFNVTDYTFSTYNFTKVYVLQQNGDYKDTTQRKAYHMVTRNDPLAQRIFSVNELVDVYVEVPTQFGTAKLKINDANITAENIKVSLIDTGNYTGLRSIKGPMSDFFAVAPTGISFTDYDFTIPYNESRLTPDFFLHCTNFDFNANNCTTWTRENITTSSYLTSTTNVQQKTPLRCVEFQSFGGFSPDTFALYATTAGGFTPLFFDDFEYRMDFWTAPNVSATIDSRSRFSGDNAFYVVANGSLGSWVTKDVDYDSNQKPFVSFAYNVTAGTKFNFEAFSQTDNKWIIYNGTDSGGNYSLPGFTADSTWRFAMISLDRDLDQLIGTGTHSIRKLRFGTNLTQIDGKVFHLDDVLVVNNQPQGMGDVQYSNDFDYQYQIDELGAIDASKSLSGNAYTGTNSIGVTCSSSTNNCKVMKGVHYFVADYPLINFAYKVPSTAQVGLLLNYKDYSDGLMKTKCLSISYVSQPTECNTMHTIANAQADNTWRTADISLSGLFGSNQYEIFNIELKAKGNTDTFNIDTFEVRKMQPGACTSCTSTVQSTATLFSNNLASYDVTAYTSGWNGTLNILVPKESSVSSATIYFDAYKNLTSSGALLTLDSSDAGANAGMSAPQGVDVDANGVIYVTDTAKKNVKLFWPNETLKLSISTAILSTSSSDPSAVEVNSTGHMFVLDRHSSERKLKVYNSSGASRDNITLPYTDSPWGVALSATNIYVTDTFTKNINVLNPTTYALASNITGFIAPKGIYVNSSGNIFVADDCSVKILRTDGSLLKKIGGGTSNLCGTGDYLFKQVSDVATDSNGKIYVADTGNHRIQIYDKEGTYRSTIGLGSCTAGASGLCNPFGVEVDSNGYIYISDTSNSRVQKFDTLTPTFTADIGKDNANLITTLGQSTITSELQTLANTCSCTGCKISDYSCLINVSVSSSGNVRINSLNVVYSGSTNDFAMDYVSDFEGNYGGWSSVAGESTNSKIAQDVSTFYMGRSSLRVNNTAGGTMLANFTPRNGLSFDTNRRPYLMFAYKVPAGIQFKVVLGDGTNNFMWNGSAKKLNSEIAIANISGFIADNTWRTAVIAVDDNLDALYGEALTYTIRNVTIGNNTAASANDAFWIDDFVIANKPPGQCPYKQEKKEYSFSAGSFDGGGPGQLKPDLNITNLTIAPSPASPNHGSNVTWNVTVRNDGDTTANGVNVSFTIDEVYAGYNDTIDSLAVGQEWVTFVWNAQYGNHTFRANATTTSDDLDLTNNWADYNISVLDNIAPTVTINTPVEGQTYANPVTLNYLVTDNTDLTMDCEYVLNTTYVSDAGSVANNTNDIESMSTDGGENTVYTTCLDDSNNRGNSTVVTFRSSCNSGTECGTGEVCVDNNNGYGICTACNSTYEYRPCSNSTLGSYAYTALNSLCWANEGASAYSCLPAVQVSGAGYPKIYQSGVDRTNIYADINDTIEFRNSLATKIGSLTVDNIQFDCTHGGCAFTNATTYTLTTTPTVTVNNQTGSQTGNTCGVWSLYSEVVAAPGSESRDYELNATGTDASSINALFANVTVDDVYVTGTYTQWLSGNSTDVVASLTLSYCTSNATRTATLECYLDCSPVNADNSGTCPETIGSSTQRGNYTVLRNVTAGNHALTIYNMTPADAHYMYCTASDDGFETFDTDTTILADQFSTLVNTSVGITTAQPWNEGNDITVQVNASDVNSRVNLTFIQLQVNSTAGNLFFDNLTTVTGGDCTAVDAKNYTCSVTLKDVDAGVYTIRSYVENYARYYAAATMPFSVEGLSCIANVKNNTIRGTIDTAKFSVIRVPAGDVYNFTIKFYNDSNLVGTVYSDINGFASLDYTTPNAGTHNYTTQCTKGELYDSYTTWIETVGSTLNITPTSKVFQVGKTAFNVYTYTLKNPSSNTQNYNLTIRSTNIISRFSENEKTTMTLTLPPNSIHTGHIDILPTRVGTETVEVWFVNLDSPADSISADSLHVKFDAVVRSSYPVGIVDVEIADEMGILQLVILLLLAMLYLRKTL